MQSAGRLNFPLTGHGWAKDRNDHHARDEALRIAREEPLAGLSPLQRSGPCIFRERATLRRSLTTRRRRCFWWWCWPANSRTPSRVGSFRVGRPGNHNAQTYHVLDCPGCDCFRDRGTGVGAGLQWRLRSRRSSSRARCGKLVPTWSGGTVQFPCQWRAGQEFASFPSR
jgi:hypothetical protein